MGAYDAQINAWTNAVQFRNATQAQLNLYNGQLASGIPAQTVQNSIKMDAYSLAFVDPVIRLYQASFNRIPDQSGASFWTNRYANDGAAILTASVQFANSAEFGALYNGANASTLAVGATGIQLITAFYVNVLQRQPDTDGLNYWLNQKLTAAQLLNEFAQSTENQNNSAPYIYNYQQAQIDGTLPNNYPSLWTFDVNPDYYTLTTSPDTATAHVFDGPQAYNPGGTNLINTLQSEDKLTGASNYTDNKLNFSLGNWVADDEGPGNYTVTPSVKSVQTFNGAFLNTKDGVRLDYQDVSGTTTANITRIADNIRAQYINMNGGEVTTLGIANTAQEARVTETFLNNTLKGGQTVALNLSNANLQSRGDADAALVIRGTLPTGGDLQQAVETFNINVVGTQGSSISSFDTGASSFNNPVNGDVPQTVNISAAQNFSVGTLRWQGNRVEVTAADHVNPVNDVGTDGIGFWRPGQISTVTATGAGNVTLANVGSHVSSDPHVIANTATTTWSATQSASVTGNEVDATLNASTLTGNLSANLSYQTAVEGGLSGADAAGSLAYNAVTQQYLSSVVGGTGNDRFYAIDTDVLTSITGGGGNDSLTVQNDVDTQVTVDLRAGSGIETLNIVDTPTNGLTPMAFQDWNIDLTNGGFQNLTINNQNAAGNTLRADIAAYTGQTLSVRSHGFDSATGNPVATETGRVDINVSAYGTTSTDGTTSVQLGAASDDRATTSALSWVNNTAHVGIYDYLNPTDAAAQLNLNLVLNSAGAHAAGNVALTSDAYVDVNLSDFVSADGGSGTTTVTSQVSATNTLHIGARADIELDLHRHSTYSNPQNALSSQTYNGAGYAGDQEVVFSGNTDYTGTADPSDQSGLGTQALQLAAATGTAALEGYTISTGGGDDVLDLASVTTNASRTAAGYQESSFLLNTSINAAGGSDEVVLSATLVDPRQVLTPDRTFDGYFKNWSGVEALTINAWNVGSSPVGLALDGYAQATGIATFNAVDINTGVNNRIDGDYTSQGLEIGFRYTNDLVVNINDTTVRNKETNIDSHGTGDITVNLDESNFNGTGTDNDLFFQSTGSDLDNTVMLNYNRIGDNGLNVDGGLAATGNDELFVKVGSLDAVNASSWTGAYVDPVTKATKVYSDLDGQTVSFTTHDGWTAAGETTTYNFSDVNNGGTGSANVVFEGAAETDASGLTIIGSSDGVSAGGVNNSFGGSAGDDTISSGGYQDTIYGRDGDDIITYVNATAKLGTDAPGAFVEGGQGDDVISVTVNINANNAASELYGEDGNDTITVNAGDNYISGGRGLDKITAGIDGDVIVGGENADSVALGSDGVTDNVYQGSNDSTRAVSSNFGPGLTITAGDTLTFSNGVDVVTGFTAGLGGDVLWIDTLVTPTTLIGEDAANISHTGFLSGNYNATTGLFTITTDGTGRDTIIFQASGIGGRNLTTGVVPSNENAIILVGVDSDNLVPTNFDANVMNLAADTTITLAGPGNSNINPGTPTNEFDGTNQARAAGITGIVANGGTHKGTLATGANVGVVVFDFATGDVAGSDVASANELQYINFTTFTASAGSSRVEVTDGALNETINLQNGKNNTVNLSNGGSDKVNSSAATGANVNTINVSGDNDLALTTTAVANDTINFTGTGDISTTTNSNSTTTIFADTGSAGTILAEVTDNASANITITALGTNSTSKIDVIGDGASVINVTSGANSGAVRIDTNFRGQTGGSATATFNRAITNSDVFINAAAVTTSLIANVGTTLAFDADWTNVDTITLQGGNTQSYDIKTTDAMNTGSIVAGSNLGTVKVDAGLESSVAVTIDLDGAGGTYAPIGTSTAVFNGAKIATFSNVNADTPVTQNSTVTVNDYKLGGTNASLNVTFGDANDSIVITTVTTGNVDADDWQLQGAGGSNSLKVTNAGKSVTFNAGDVIAFNTINAGGDTLYSMTFGATDIIANTTINFNNINGASALANVLATDAAEASNITVSGDKTLTGLAFDGAAITATVATNFATGAGADTFNLIQTAANALDTGTKLDGNGGADEAKVQLNGFGLTVDISADSDITNIETFTFVNDSATAANLSFTYDNSQAALANINAFLTGTAGNATIVGTGATVAMVANTGAGDDNITGTAQGDTINTRNGSDTINGAGGNDTIDAGNGNNNVTGGTGSDLITLATGNNTLVYGADTRDGATIYTDGVLGFQFGAGNDTLRFAAADINADGGAALPLSASDGAGGAAIAAAATSLSFAVTSAGGVQVATGAAYTQLVVSSTTGNSWATALNGASVTVSNANTFLGVYYDADANAATKSLSGGTGGLVYGAVTSADATVNGADTFNAIGIVDMAAGDYSTFNAANIIWI